MLRITKRIPNPITTPVAHQHKQTDDYPTICFDFNKTLTPSEDYPITAAPFPNVKPVLDTLKSRGACLHITTGSMYVGTSDIGIYLARRALLQAWLDQYQLPMDFIGAKVPSDCYYDDRMVEVPPLSSEVDWNRIGDEIFTRLLTERGFTLDLSGDAKYHRQPNIVEPGREIDNFPRLSDVPPEQPRGFSGPSLDVDLHGTASTGGASTKVGPPFPGAVQSIKKFYDSGITIRMSCPGWSPLSHSAVESNQRLAGLRKWLSDYNVSYDNVVTKDHGDLFVDDKGIKSSRDNGGNWGKDIGRIQARLDSAKLQSRAQLRGSV